MFGNIPLIENQDYFAFKKQNEVSQWSNLITMIVTIDFRLFPDKKSKNFQNVLFGNRSIGNYRMLLLQLVLILFENNCHLSCPERIIG